MTGYGSGLTYGTSIGSGSVGLFTGFDSGYVSGFGFTTSTGLIGSTGLTTGLITGSGSLNGSTKS